MTRFSAPVGSSPAEANWPARLARAADGAGLAGDIAPQRPGRAGVRPERRGQYPDRGGRGDCVGILHERLVPAGDGIMTLVAPVRSQ